MTANRRTSRGSQGMSRAAAALWAMPEEQGRRWDAWWQPNRATAPSETRPTQKGQTPQEAAKEAARLQALAARAVEDLASAPPQDVIAWAVGTFADRVCLTSSMTDAVIIHLAAQVRHGIDVIFLDTGYHFAETIGTRDAVAASYPVNLINVTPSRTVAEQDAELGPRLYGRNPDLCCYLRKVVPLELALDPYDAWITGVRREETDARSETPVVEWDAKRAMVKVNPIAGWSQEQVDGYVAAHGVLLNPLVDHGYPSIGCATCTLPVKPGADPRSGRWAGTGKTECGLHTRLTEQP